jgi:hypothetical protein
VNISVAKIAERLANKSSILTTSSLRIVMAKFRYIVLVAAIPRVPL